MEYLVSGWAASLRASAWLLFFFGAAVSGGAFFLRMTGFKETELSAPERSLFSAGTGLTLLSLTVWAAGLFELLHPKAPLTIGVLFYAPAFLLKDVRTCLFWGPLPGGRRLIKTAFFLAMSACVLSWLQTTLPPTAADGLSYHLTHPKMFLERHGLYAIPYAREALWPYLVEMLFLIALPTGGTILATLFHWLFFVMTAWALYLFGVRFLSRAAGWTAALLWLFTPGAFAQSGQPYVDLALSFYFFLGLYAFFLYDRTSRDAYAWVLGLFIGAALGVKYLALGAAGLWAFTFAWRARKMKPFLLFVMGAALFGGGWYLRSWLVLGNPVYPFFPVVFGSGFPTDIGSGYEKDLKALLWLPYSLTLEPARSGGDILGPYALWAAPALLLSLKRFRGAWGSAALVGLGFTVFIFTQSPNSRFFLAVMPWVCLGAGALLAGFLKETGLLRWAAAAALACTFALHGGIFLFRTREAWSLFSGSQSAQAYLEKYDRSRKGYGFLEEALRPGEKVFNAAEAKFFYARRPEAFVQYNGIFRAAQPEGILRHLDQARYDYLWVERDFNRDVIEFAEKNNYETALEYEFMEAPKTYHYRIYKRP